MEIYNFIYRSRGSFVGDIYPDTKEIPKLLKRRKQYWIKKYKLDKSVVYHTCGSDYDNNYEVIGAQYGNILNLLDGLYKSRLKFDSIEIRNGNPYKVHDKREYEELEEKIKLSKQNREDYLYLSYETRQYPKYIIINNNEYIFYIKMQKTLPENKKNLIDIYIRSINTKSTNDYNFQETDILYLNAVDLKGVKSILKNPKNYISFLEEKESFNELKNQDVDKMLKKMTRK